MMFLIGVFLLLLPFKIIGFNIDTNHFIVYVDPQKINSSSSSYFGYTVMLYPGEKNGMEKWIKIGAPKGQDPKINFTNPGVVYNCPFMKTCTPVDVTRGYHEESDLLNGAWIGGSMDISYKYGRLTICGFRSIYKRTYITLRRTENIDYNMVGFCYLSYLNTSFSKIAPLKNDGKILYIIGKSQVYYYGQGEAGFSVHFPENENAVILGAPGVYNWAGTIVQVVDNIYDEPESNKLIGHKTKRSVFHDTSVADATSSTSDSGAFDLFGYSITSGYFYNNPKRLYYAASTPKYKDYKGKVAVVQFRGDNALRQATSVVGSQFGEYFGASTASGDLNRDGIDDLIVGAPFHVDKTYNEGAVYIFLGRKSEGQLNKQQTLYGQRTNGQFGSAIMFLGDLNNDGFGDLAIGAPYEEEFSGVLYIYRGNKEGTELQPCQRIVGKHISSEIRGFGISISRPADIDENGYKDIVVGAYLSGNAVLLRTSPIVVVYYKMESIPKELKQDSKQFLLNVCYWYTLFKENTVELNRTIIVGNLRGYLKNPNESIKTITVKSEKGTCENITISLKKVILKTANYVEPITVSLSYKLANEQKKKEVVYISEKYKNGEDNFCVRCPVLDKFRSSPPSSIKVPFGLNCGSDNLCQSQLTVEAKFPDLTDNTTFVVGSLDYLTLTTTIRNTGEYAYSTQLEIMLPDLINFRQIPSICNEQNISVIICDVDNPLRNNTERTVVLNLDMKKVNKNCYKKKLTISLRVLTVSVNSNPDRKTLTLALRREADIMITGKSGQQSVPFGNITHGMPNFTQIYQVEKIGASPLEKVQVNITVPHSIKLPSGATAGFIKVYPPEGTFAGQPVICSSNFEYIMESKSVKISEKLKSDTILLRRRRQVDVFKEMGVEKNQDIVIAGKEYDLVANRTYFLNCSMENIVCSSILCTIGPFQKRQAPATIQIRMMFNPSVISGLMGEKDVVLYSTQGTAEIQVPPKFVQTGNRPDFVEVSTLFINEVVKKKRVALWIIILAAVAGSLLLALIIYGLTKVGFFKRAKKEELKNLKAAAGEIGETEPTPEPLDPTVNCSTEGLVDEDQKEEQ